MHACKCVCIHVDNNIHNVTAHRHVLSQVSIDEVVHPNGRRSCFVAMTKKSTISLISDATVRATTVTVLQDPFIQRWLLTPSSSASSSLSSSSSQPYLPESVLCLMNDENCSNVFTDRRQRFLSRYTVAEMHPTTLLHLLWLLSDSSNPDPPDPLFFSLLYYTLYSSSSLAPPNPCFVLFFPSSL